jgi:hypothetical protein
MPAQKTKGIRMKKLADQWFVESCCAWARVYRTNAVENVKYTKREQKCYPK